jgi:hypothetical protein
MQSGEVTSFTFLRPVTFEDKRAFAAIVYNHTLCVSETRVFPL